MKFAIGILFLLLVFAVTPAAAQGNLMDSCVQSYDSTVDYFPDKVSPNYAQGWQVEYHNHYKVLRVITPWPGAAAEDTFEYVLVQCGTPTPEGYDGDMVIEVPSGKLIALSTSYIPHVVNLGLLDHLIGMDSSLYVSNPEVVERFASGQLIEVGSGTSVNVELILNAEPDLVLTFGSGIPEYDTHPVLLDAGVPVVVASDYAELSPLGQAEWGKFISLFYNAEAAANASFDAIITEYNALAALTENLPDAERPTVLWNNLGGYADAWYLPGSESFAAQYIRDAGGSLILGDAPELLGVTGTMPFSFEVVYEAGADADVWMPGTFGVRTIEDFVAQDQRYADFAPVKNGEVYNYDARENSNGGNDYFETGVANPQLVLADLIAILHPELLPDHELNFFRRLPLAS